MKMQDGCVMRWRRRRRKNGLTPPRSVSRKLSACGPSLVLREVSPRPRDLSTTPCKRRRGNKSPHGSEVKGSARLCDRAFGISPRGVGPSGGEVVGTLPHLSPGLPFSSETFARGQCERVSPRRLSLRDSACGLMRPDTRCAVLVVCLCVVSAASYGVLAAEGSTHTSEKCRTACSIQSGRGIVRSGDVCHFKYYPAGGCIVTDDDEDDEDVGGGGTRKPPDPPTGGASPPKRRRRPMARLQLNILPYNALNAALDFSIPVNHSRMILVVLNGVTKTGSERCVTVEFSQRPGWQASTLRASCLTLPHGIYNMTVLTTTEEPHEAQGHEEKEGASSDVGHLKEGKKKEGVPRLAIIARHSFPLPFVDRYSALGKPGRHRSKRVGKRTHLTTEDLFLGPHATSGPAACPCYHCLEPNHTYHTETAFLQFSFTVNTSQACCVNCSRMNLVLYQYVNMDDDYMCEALNFTPQVVSGLRLVNTDKNITQGPVDYPNIGTGCYAFRLRPSANPSPIYHGFLWLKAKVNVTNMDDWNTTFFLHPDHERGTLEVRWTAPSYPFNFSSYGLQLWHNKNSSITCRGETIYRGPIVVIPKNEKIFLETTNYTFHNLSQGWYCVRVTPIDDRCPPDGCQPRSSLAKQLLGIQVVDPEEAPQSITPGILGAGVAILVAGVLLACLVLRCRSSHGVFGVSYTKVNVGKKLSEGGVLLLVWTKAGPYGDNLAPVIVAFKKVLSSYAKFKVYDYLDLLSLSPDQRQHLLASPAAWLDTILAQHNVKIIIVGSEGARQRQLEGSCAPGHEGSFTEYEDPLDRLLFPYLLRRLQDRPDLAGDYSRVFHVRFAEICSEKAELEGVVSWTRYRLPEHLRSLTLSLHGISEDCDLEEPPTDLLAEMHSAMVAHPMYSFRSNHNANHRLTKEPHTSVPVHPLPTPPSSEASCDGHSSDVGADGAEVVGNDVGKL